jgi:hypothetical protein
MAWKIRSAGRPSTRTVTSEGSPTAVGTGVRRGVRQGSTHANAPVTGWGHLGRPGDAYEEAA